MKARANSLEFDISPMTLKVVNLNKYLVQKQLIFELLRNTNTMSVFSSSQLLSPPRFIGGGGGGGGEGGSFFLPFRRCEGTGESMRTRFS